MAIVDNPEIESSLVGAKPTVVQLPDRLTDQQQADSIRQSVQTAFPKLLEAMDFARRQGFVVTWDGVPLGPSGRHSIPSINVTKHF